MRIFDSVRLFRSAPWIGWLWLVASIVAFAQEDVHITPRISPRSDTSAAAGVGSELNSHTKPLRSDVNLVLVPVSVTDPADRIVTGLRRENFEIYQDKQKQELRHLSSEDIPISIGVIFDASGSMKGKIDTSKEAVSEFMRTANLEDDFFVMAFSDRPFLVSDVSKSISEVNSNLVFLQPNGRTALLDAVYMGINKLQQAVHKRKVLLVLSDGGDNHSRYNEREVQQLVKEADVQIYAIGMFEASPPTIEESRGPELLGDLADATGGRFYIVNSPGELANIATSISVQLRHQYVLTYVPRDKPVDGKWHKIRVKLQLPKGLPPLTVHAKRGFYAVR